MKQDGLRALIAYKDRLNDQMFRDSRHCLVVAKNFKGYQVLITGKSGVDSYLGGTRQKVTFDFNPPLKTMESLRSMVQDGHLKRIRDYFDSKEAQE